jgi:hypothetical protein
MADEAYKIESFAEMRKRLGWKFHLRIFAFVAVTASITLYLVPAYYFAASAASGAVGLIFMRYWVFSRRGWFWMTMGPMILGQAPFIVVSRDIANNWRWSFGFLFMLVDFVVMDLVVRWVSPELRRDT